MGEQEEGSVALLVLEQSTEATFCWILADRPLSQCSVVFSPVCTAGSA